MGDKSAGALIVYETDLLEKVEQFFFFVSRRPYHQGREGGLSLLTWLFTFLSVSMYIPYLAM